MQMEVLNNVSSALEAEPSPTINPQCVASNFNNPGESTFINMEIEGRLGHTAISIAPADHASSQVPNPTSRLEWYHNYSGILYLIYATTLLVMYPSMIALVDLKFQNNARSVFETHGVFANMAVVAYITAIPTSVALFYLKSLNGESLPPIYLRMLQSVFYFSSLLAPLSFLLVLFLPRGFNLIGYMLVFTLFLVIVACSFGDYICKKDAPLESTIIEE